MYAVYAEGINRNGINCYDVTERNDNDNCCNIDVRYIEKAQSLNLTICLHLTKLNSLCFA